MANENLNAPYQAYRPISFNFSAGQSTKTFSVGSWSLQQNQHSTTSFTVPQTMLLKIFDIKQNKILSTTLRLAYRTNVSPKIESISKKTLPIIIKPLWTFQFIAYPRLSPKVAVTEVATAKIHACLVFNKGWYQQVIC